MGWGTEGTLEWTLTQSWGAAETSSLPTLLLGAEGGGEAEVSKDQGLAQIQVCVYERQTGRRL